MERKILLELIDQARGEALDWDIALKQMEESAAICQSFIEGKIDLSEFIAGTNKVAFKGFIKADLTDLETIFKEFFPFGARNLVDHEVCHVEIATKYGLRSETGVWLAKKKNELKPTVFMALTFVEFQAGMNENLARQIAREIASAPGENMSWSDKKSLPNLLS